MQVSTCGCLWSVDISVSIDPNDTEIGVDPGMARYAANRQTLEEKVWTSGLPYYHIHHTINSMFSLVLFWFFKSIWLIFLTDFKLKMPTK